MILSMDLSLSGAAFAVLDIKTNGKVEIVDTSFVNNKKNASRGHGYRLEQIAKELDYLLHVYKIKYLVREKGFSKFAKATQTLFKVVGVSDLTLFRNGIEKDIEEIPPLTVKKLVAGKGTAGKDIVAQGVRKFLIDEQKDFIFQTDDISDAVAIGIAYALQNGLMEGEKTA